MLQFAVTLDKESYAPGETISMIVSAAKDSYVALSVIGQIVMLVENKRNNFDMNDVLHELAEYTYGGFEHSFEIHVSCILHFAIVFASFTLNN